MALISLRAKQLEESATLAVSAKAAKMKAEGVDVVSFGAGEPDFDTPEHIKQGAYEAIKKGMTKYATPASTAPAKEAVCERLKKENDLEYKPGQVLLTVGGKEALYLAIMALMDPGDECIIPVPYWVSYPEMVKLAQGESVFIEGKEENEFKLTPRPDRREDHQEDQGIRLQQPVEPGRLHVQPGRDQGDRRHAHGLPQRGHPVGRDVRQATVHRRQIPLLRRHPQGDVRANGHLQRRLQDLLYDGLADWVCGWPH